MPEPELADGADVLLRPLPELVELGLAEADPDELEPDEPDRPDEPELTDELPADAVAGWADPGRV